MGGIMPGKKTPASSGIARDLCGLASRFALNGEFVSAAPYGSGHIHETYRLRVGRAADPGYILQRINTGIFPDVPRLMENIMSVTAHLRRRLAAVPDSDPEREVLTVIPAHDGRPWHRDAAGDFWRCFRFIEHLDLGERPQTPGQAFEAGRIFGRFIDLLSDLPPASLHEIIPRFHDVEFRLEQFHAARQTDPLGRSRETGAEIDFVLARAEDMNRVRLAGRQGRIRLRVTHNDTKFNNVLFDRAQRGLCPIDLDTVMPGYLATDFGDAVRSAASSALEDEGNPVGIRVDLDVFRELARGFLFSLGAGIDEGEIGLLAFGAKLLTFLVGLRFLTDHLAGDVYFKTARPGHNLQRARAQFALLADMERHSSEMEEIVGTTAAKMNGG
jgi:hypothetical protein